MSTAKEVLTSIFLDIQGDAAEKSRFKTLLRDPHVQTLRGNKNGVEIVRIFMDAFKGKLPETNPGYDFLTLHAPAPAVTPSQEDAPSQGGK